MRESHRDSFELELARGQVEGISGVMDHCYCGLEKSVLLSKAVTRLMHPCT